MKAQARGAALITVLLVTALAATLCFALMQSQRLAIRASAGQSEARQAWHFAQGGEQLAGSLLAADARDAAATDHPGEAWAQSGAAEEIAGNRIAVRIVDLSGRLNLNSLVRQDAVDVHALQRLQRLLGLLRMDPDLAWHVVYWIRPDLAPDPIRAAVQRDQATRALPAREAGRPLVDVSELRLLAPLDADAYRRLAMHVVALPPSTGLNVNTADPWVLASLADGLSLDDGQAMAAARGRTGHPTVAAFLQQPRLARVPVPSVGLDVRSDHFGVITDVVTGTRRLRLVSHLHRAPAGVRVLDRALVPPYMLEPPR